MLQNRIKQRPNEPLLKVLLQLHNSHLEKDLQLHHRQPMSQTPIFTFPIHLLSSHISLQSAMTDSVFQTLLVAQIYKLSDCTINEKCTCVPSQFYGPSVNKNQATVSSKMEHSIIVNVLPITVWLLLMSVLSRKHDLSWIDRGTSLVFKATLNTLNAVCAINHILTTQTEKQRQQR